MRSQTRRQQGNGRAILAAAAGMMLSLVLLSACGGNGDGPALSGSQVSAAGVTLSLPEGWTFLDNGERGLVLAELEADLRDAPPQGPRLTVEPGSTAPPDPEALVSAMAGTDGAAARVEVVEEPDTIPVGAEVGVSIGLLEDEGGSTVLRRYVIVNVDGVNVYLFVLEAPEGKWDSNVDTLEAILGSAAFEPPQVAAEAPTASDGPTEPAPRPTPTPVSQDTAGFDTPEEAIYADSGFEASPIIECSSRQAERTYPCFRFWGQADDGGLIYQYLITNVGVTAWVLVSEQTDGTYVVEDVVFEPVELEDAREPPF